jgi:hypothetical protein
VQPSTPIFTSSPVTTATQDVAYTYQLAATDPAGGSVTFSLTTEPTGAVLSGNTVSWTPTAVQSRVPNSFAVTATTASGGSASQSWTVTPGGTIVVNWVDTYWTPSGAVQIPKPASESLSISAIVNNPDGSITVEKSAATSPGVFSILNVPGGYYWLEIAGSAYWTSAAAFDAGHDIPGAPVPTTGSSQNTGFIFSLAGLQGVPQTSTFAFTFPITPTPAGEATILPNATTFNGQFAFGGGTDWSQVPDIFLMQYLPVSLGSLNNLVLGPELTASVSLTSGTVNPITETLLPSPQVSLDLNVPGSQWDALFNSAAPATPIRFASALTLSAEAYLTGRNASSPTSAIISTSPTLVATQSAGLGLFGGGCDTTGFPQSTSSAQPAIITDQDFGTLTYGDSFPPEWTRAFSLCQESTVAIPIPDSSATANFALVNGVTVAPSSAPLAPAVSPVQNPTINGASLFTAATLATTVVPLAWTAPATGAPFGYRVLVFIQGPALNGVPSYLPAGGFYSAKTAITLPPLSGGHTYVFAIAAEVDGAANMETGPFRSALPTGFATVVSAPIAISSGALTPAIRGDRSVLTRLSQPQPRGASH